MVLGLTQAASAPADFWREEFDSGELDPARWQHTLDGDLEVHAAELVPAPEGTGARLRLLADTRGTSNATVKYVGIMSRCAVVTEANTNVSLRVDWGPPANGSYLSAAIVLSPHTTAGNPLTTPDWLSVAYVGVPPGRNARLLVRMSNNGVVRTLYRDGWPDANRAGRYITRPTLQISLGPSSLELREDGRLVFSSTGRELPTIGSHLFLQLSSHSNFPARSVHFEDLRLQSGGADGPVVDWPAYPDCGEDAAGAR